MSSCWQCSGQWAHSGAHAQSDNGSIVGTVTDSTGAVIPNATVTVTNADTGLKLTGTSNSAGEFQIFAVPRCNYKADVGAQGFQSQTGDFCRFGGDHTDPAVQAGAGCGE